MCNMLLQKKGQYCFNSRKLFGLCASTSGIITGAMEEFSLLVKVVNFHCRFTMYATPCKFDIHDG